MSTARQFEPISVRDYLRAEEDAGQKHEYLFGVVYAMVGAKNVHNRIATNITGALHAQLRGKPCQVFNSDTKVRVQQAKGICFYYPDALVACRLNPASDTFQDQPVVVVEVISESTRRTDENEKRDAYLSIDSLCQYILVESETIAAVVYRRGDSGFERETIIGGESVIDLPEIGCHLSLAEAFEKVVFPAATPNDES
jgi:Uma2 family endonuclease